MLSLSVVLLACKPECGTLQGKACVVHDTGDDHHYVDTDTGPTKPPHSSSVGGWKDIASGYWHTCSIDADDKVEC